LRVQVPSGKDFGNGDRVGNVGFAAVAKLAFVGSSGDFESRIYLRDIVRLQITG
jgi:hypothetical protein